MVNDENPRGAARRQQILEAAERLFGRSGYWAGTMEDVAKQVGITQPALYRYFDSKRELFLQALTLRQKAVFRAYKEALEADVSSIEKVRLTGEATVDLVRKYPDMARMRIHAASLAAIDDEMGPVVLATMRSMMALHSGLLQAAKNDGEISSAIDPELTAALVTGQAFMMYLGLSLGLEQAQPDRAIEINNHVARILLRRDDLDRDTNKT